MSSHPLPITNPADVSRADLAITGTGVQGVTVWTPDSRLKSGTSAVRHDKYANIDSINLFIVNPAILSN